MIACIQTVYGDHLYIDTDDLVRAQRRGRKLIPIRGHDIKVVLVSFW